MLRRIVAVFVALLVIVRLAAAEEILRFVSDISVGSDGVFLVTETITVKAEGVAIRQGIYRDFSIRVIDATGEEVTTGFDLISAKRDGRPEPARVERGSRAVRVYLGNEDIFLSPGDYTYELKYRTDRQVRFFADHDEVYWNATGTEWNFPIREAVAVIRLPEGANAGQTTFYTGPYGSTEQNARVARSGDGSVVSFVTTEALGPREGLTVVVSLPKGVVGPPTGGQEWAWFLRDHLATLIAWAGTLLAAGYYVIIWRRIGRDPPEGLMVPRWDAPAGVSPALVHYIWNRGLRRQGFPAIAASALNLAVQGYVEIDDISDTVTLRKTGKATDGVKFAAGEAQILAQFRTHPEGFTISTANGKDIQRLGQSFRSAMDREHREVFYRHNRQWVFFGVLISALVTLGSLMVGQLSLFSFIALPVVVVIGGVFPIVVVSLSREWGSSLLGTLRLVFFGFFLVLWALNIGLPSIGGSLLGLEDPILIGALATLILLNLLFFFLLGAPTPLGQQRTDEIAGLRHYLSVAEEDRLNMAGAPKMSPQHFETLLPFAVALGVERPWTQAFDTWLSAALASGAMAAGSYAPGWYHGNYRDSGSIGQRMSSLGDSLSRSMTSALSAPKSSSSGFSRGGGFSGGGGGGGGGGGW